MTFWLLMTVGVVCYLGLAVLVGLLIATPDEEDDQ